ncbi:MAG: GDP-L-fucose synthase [Nitrospirota bacterium]
MGASSRIYVAGHRGMVGSAIMRKLLSEGFENIVTAASKEVDLRDQRAVEVFFEKNRPEYVLLAAAKVGGIMANSAYPAQFIYDNLLIEANIINAARTFDVKKLLFLGSSCIYPKYAPQPIKEEYLLTGPLEPTNEPYAVAKIAGIKLCQSYHRQYGCCFISLMPTNLYGPEDNFDLDSSHVIPALIRKFVDAKESGAGSVEIWGTGAPRREFLHVDDLADACLFLMREYDSPEIVNVGTGKDITIGELAELIKGITGFGGNIAYDTSKPDGTPRKLLDVSRLNALGWKAGIGLRDGLAKTVKWYLSGLTYV